MESILRVLSERFSDGAIVTSIVSTAVGGGLAHFKPWLLSQEEVRNRVSLQRQRLIEMLATIHNQIFERAEVTIPLRGDGIHPDLLAQYHSETFRALVVMKRLDAIHTRVKYVYTLLFITAAAGLVATLAAILFAGAKPVVGTASLMLILTQVGLVFYIRHQVEVLEDYEHTT